MFCKNCGSELTQNENYCHSCGCKITEDVTSVNGNPIDSKNVVNKKSSGLKKPTKIIIASVLAVVLVSGIAAASIRLGVKTANKPKENYGGASASDSVDPSEIRTFNYLLEDDNYWVPVKVEHLKHYNDNPEFDSNTTLSYDWYENEVKIKEEIAYRQNSESNFFSVTFDNNGKILSETQSYDYSTNGSRTTNYEYTNDLLSQIKINAEKDIIIDISRDSSGKITNLLYGGLPFIEYKYTSENECSICVNFNSKPFFSADYKYDNNDGINLNVYNVEILDEDLAEKAGIGIFVEPYPVISLDLNDAGMITRFSTNSLSSNCEDNYSYKTTESGYYSEYKISYDDGGYDTYKVYWERGTKSQEHTGLYRVFTDVVLNLFDEQSHSLDYVVAFVAPFFSCGENASD